MRVEKLKKSAGIITVFMIALMMSLMLTAADSVWAAEGSANINSASEVTKGETFTVTVNYSGDNLGRVRGMMKYDTSVLRYLSGGSSKGNGGAVELKRSGEGGDITFNVKFKAVGKGNCSLSLKTSDMYDLDEMDMGNPAASAKVKVNAPAAAEESQNGQQADDTQKDDQEKDSEKADGQEQDDQEVIAPAPDDQDDEEQDADETDEDAEDSSDGVSDRTKIIAIIVAAVVSILAVNLIVLRSRRKKR